MRLSSIWFRVWLFKLPILLTVAYPLLSQADVSLIRIDSEAPNECEYKVTANIPLYVDLPKDRITISEEGKISVHKSESFYKAQTPKARDLIPKTPEAIEFKVHGSRFLVKQSQLAELQKSIDWLFEAFQAPGPFGPIYFSFGDEEHWAGWSNVEFNGGSQSPKQLPHSSVQDHEISHVFFFAYFRRLVEKKLSLPLGYIEAIDHAQIEQWRFDSREEDLFKEWRYQRNVSIDRSLFGNLEQRSRAILGYNIQELIFRNELTILLKYEELIANLGAALRSGVLDPFDMQYFDQDFTPTNKELKDYPDSLTAHNFFEPTRRFLGKILKANNILWDHMDLDQKEPAAPASMQTIQHFLRIVLESTAEEIFDLARETAVGGKSFILHYDRSKPEPKVHELNRRLVQRLLPKFQQAGFRLD